MTIVGMTGSGKTTLAKTLTELRTWRIMLTTKPDDLSWSGWRTVRSASAIKPRPAESPGAPDRGTAWRLWPVYEQSPVEFNAAFDKAWKEGGWTLYIDELYHVQHAGLERQAVKLLSQGRSKKVSIVSGVQRPAWVTRFAFSEATHIFCFQCGDNRDLKALRDGVGDGFAKAAAKLERYQFVYMNKASHKMLTGTVRTLKEVLAA